MIKYIVETNVYDLSFLDLKILLSSLTSYVALCVNISKLSIYLYNNKN